MLELTARELLYAASQLGAQTFFGLPDPFFGLDENEIKQELVEIQLSLSEKGYATVGFDDVFTLKPDASEIISVCAHCDRYITADFDYPDGRQERLLFYFLDDKVVELIPLDNSVTLRLIDLADVPGRIWEGMEWPVDGEEEPLPNDMAGSIPCVALTEAESLLESDLPGAIALLKNQGCSDRLAEVLLDGLQRKVGYFTVCFADMKARTLAYTICIHASAGSVLITQVDDDDERWAFAPVDGEGVHRALSKLCGEGGSLAYEGV